MRLVLRALRVTSMYDGWHFLAEMWATVTPLVRCALVTLTFMFVWALAESLEGIANYTAAVWQSRSFVRVIQTFLAEGNSVSLLAAAESRDRSHVATVFAAGLAEFHMARDRLSVQQSMHAATLATRVAAGRLHQTLRQNLNALATISATAPFIGFFGTIIGILDSFGGSAMSRGALLARTANSLAEALVCTAMGILVATPTMCCFNWLSERLEILDTEMKITSLELEKYVEQASRAER